MQTTNKTSQGQADLRLFVNTHVLACQTSLVEKLFEELGEKDANFYLSSVDNGVVDNECVEILEWWLVDDWFIKKLRGQGEPVLENDYGIWWGRTCSGQAIALDSVIESIYNNS